jgi:hypothetical protein
MTSLTVEGSYNFNALIEGFGLITVPEFMGEPVCENTVVEVDVWCSVFCRNLHSRMRSLLPTSTLLQLIKYDGFQRWPKLNILPVDTVNSDQTLKVGMMASVLPLTPAVALVASNRTCRIDQHGSDGRWVVTRRDTTSEKRNQGKVRCAFFGRNLHSRMPLDPTHVRLKLLHACDQWHSSRKFTPLTGLHCKLRPNTEGAVAVVI